MISILINFPKSKIHENALNVHFKKRQMHWHGAEKYIKFLHFQRENLIRPYKRPKTFFLDEILISNKQGNFTE